MSARSLASLVIASVLQAGVADGAPPAPVHPKIAGGGAQAPEPLGQVVLDGETFYAHGADLLGLDRTRPTIVRRVRLAARIGALVVEDGLLVVTLVPRSDYGVIGERLRLPGFRPEAPPSSGFYGGGLADSLLPLREARAAALGWDIDGPTTFDAARMKAAVVGLSKWEAVDRTNPYAPALRGEILARLGDEAGAGAAYRAAADLPLASPFDLLRVSTLLEDRGAKGPAETAYLRGRGVADFAAMESQVSVQVLLGVPRIALARALGEGDVAEVDRLSLRLAALFPRAEGGGRAWNDLAAFMDAHGRADLAAAWRARALTAQAGLPAAFAELPAQIDRRVPLYAGMSLVLPLAALAVGMRRGARALRGRAALADLLGPLLVVGATAWFAFDLAARVQVLGRASSVPLTLLDGARHAPDAQRWAEDHLAPSVAKERVLASLRGGARPDDATLRVAFARPQLRRALATTLSGDASLPTGGGLRLPYALLAAAALYGLGFMLGRRTREASGPARWYLLSRVTPGGPSGLGPLGAPLAGLAIGGALALAGQGSHLSEIAAPDPTRYFGLETVARPAPPPDLRWAWTAVTLWLGLHLLAVRIDRKRLAALAAFPALLLLPRSAGASPEKPGRFVIDAHADLLAGASLGSGFEQCPCESRQRPFGGTVGGRAGYDFAFGFVFEIDAAYQYGVSTSVVRAGQRDDLRTSGLVVSLAGGYRIPVGAVELTGLLGVGSWMGIVTASRSGVKDESVETTAPLLAPGVRAAVPLGGPLRAGVELGAWIGVADEAQVHGQRAMGWFVLGHGSVFVRVAL